MDKNSKEKIKQLREEKKYEEIYVQFGEKIFNKYVPHKYKKEDIKKLKQEKRWQDIYNKYGETEYNKILTKAMYEEIKEVRGNVKATMWRIGRKMSNIAKQIGINSGVTFLALTSVFAAGTQSTIKENEVEYESEINAYNEKISKYSEEIKNMHLSDIQTFMKVMDDMWKNIKGYANPEKNISGFLELDLATEEGYGVCRNMASDVARKLNEINPEWNARTMCVLMPEEVNNLKIANIERTILETNETVAETTKEEENTQQEEKLANLVQNLSGNHMVTLVDIAEDNITLVLDPTNPGIGIYQNGNIIMLNSSDGQDITYKSKEYMTAIGIKGGANGINTTIQEYAQSFAKPNITMEELKEKYGVEAQNKALDEIRTGNLHNKSKEKMFRESMKIDLLKQEAKPKPPENSIDTNEKNNIVKNRDNEGR